MSEIIKTLNSFSDLVSMKPVSETEIANAEAQLKLTFATEYKEFVSEFGAVAVNGHEITGIVSSPRLNVVAVTKREWSINVQVPRTLYVVENAGIDGIIVWQDADGKIYQSVPSSKLKELASSLADYIKC